MRDFRSKAIRRVRSIPAQLATKAINLAPISARLDRSYERKRVMFRSSLIPMEGLDLAIINDLRQNGVFMTTLSELNIPNSERMYCACQDIKSNYQKKSREGCFEASYLVQATAEELIGKPEIFHWGLSERLLRLAETYLEMPVGYDGLNLFYTPADGREVAARRWHRDVEDRRMMKVSVLLNDVDEYGGPLQILRQKFAGSDKIEGANYPVLTNKQLEQRLGRPLIDDDITTCTGPEGTVIFSDVASHYHRGKPATRRDRCAVFFNYITRTPLRPFYCERNVFDRSQIKELVRDLMETQKSYALWYDSLPLIAKLVPRAPL